MASVKPSAQFVASFNKMKKNGLTEKEVTALGAQASKDIAKSSKPRELAEVYAKEVKGWVAKGLTKAEGTPEMLPYSFQGAADAKLIRDAVKYVKANAAALVAKYPGLKNIDFSKTTMNSGGDGNFLEIRTKAGVAIGESEPTAVLLKKALGKDYKDVMIGFGGGGC
ncbi:MAG: hypothetical protein JNG84_12375 [Archangium sp.]|nr:hypothetical protein [Archangium sp.]